MTDRREFIRTSLLAAVSIVAAPVLAGTGQQDNKKISHMKKIMIIDGGPRRNMNTAAMVEAFAEGARSAGAEVKHVRPSRKHRTICTVEKQKTTEQRENRFLSW